MHNLAKSLLITLVFVSFGASTAAAEIFQWRDPETKLTVMYPDTWRSIHHQKPDEILSVVAPGQNDFAGCRIRVNEDRRFVIYPRNRAGAIQRTAVSREFWENYINEFDNATLHNVTDNGGLGNGFASYADVSFVTAVGPRVQKRGLMFATIYNDKAYVFECSAEHSAYDKWHRNFLSMVQSLDMRQDYATTRNGHYREFLEDPELRIHGMKPVDLYVY